MNDIKTNSGADAPEQIVKKLLGEVPAFDKDIREVEALARFVGCDIALEYRGKPNGIDPFDIICNWGPVPTVKGKLWLWSIKVIGDKRKISAPIEDKGCAVPLSSPVIQVVRA